jgi:hypothetical protein
MSEIMSHREYLQFFRTAMGAYQSTIVTAGSFPLHMYMTHHNMRPTWTPNDLDIFVLSPSKDSFMELKRITLFHFHLLGLDFAVSLLREMPYICSGHSLTCMTSP